MYKKYFKRSFDLFLSILLLIVLSPIFLTISFLILIIDGRPIFFIQSRPGYKNIIFKIIKFRTMKNYKHKKDFERISKLGHFLRITSIDEIPEIINVLKGDMSFVGPRPLLEEYIPYYSKDQIKRHNCLPGITGLAQVNGRNKLDWDDKFKLDLEYIENINFINDMKILLKSVLIIFQFKNVNSDNINTMKKFSKKQ